MPECDLPKVSLSVGIQDPHNMCFLGHIPLRVDDPNGISVGSAILAQLTAVIKTHRQTDIQGGSDK